LDKGADGFRVDSAPYIFEDEELRDEPRSYTLGATPDQYTYLDHIYTANLKPTYELFGSWRKYLDEYADEHNQDQKVNKAILFFQIYMFLLIDLENVLFLISLDVSDGGVHQFRTYSRIL